ncbi:MAG: alcohol dehydrogenase catalytic domain-containing protein [Pseudonocardia sp.]|nr:alcohol dehydrogenase catalytic domain-containing protein [Pseudonocardia sp.]
MGSHPARLQAAGLGLNNLAGNGARSGPDPVLLAVAACGACHSDVHKLEGHGLVAPPFVFGPQQVAAALRDFFGGR